MNSDPAAFLSYVRDDDAHELGRLSEFCKRLRGEVRMQGWDEFEIFQDRNDLAWGQQWQQRIGQSLDATTFLIPIITPRFFQHPACRDELERFLNREKRLKRNDLILPVYYIDTPLLNDEKKRKTDKLATIIAERQYADFRELRFEPFTNPQVGKMLAQVAAQVIAAIEREPSTGKQTTTASKRPRRKRAKKRLVEEHGASTSTGQEGASAGDSTKNVRGPAPKTEPPTIVVDALHRGDYPTVTAALAAANPGDRILVRPGLYRESLVIDKPVEIIGDGELGEVVIEGTAQDAILFQASMGRIANLTLRQTGEDEVYCVDISQGRLDLEGCDISSQSLACVTIHGGADPRLRRNRIHDGKDVGVMVDESSLGTLEDNDIFGNAFSGVEIREQSNPTLRRNRIHDGKSGGVYIHGNSLATLEDNDIFGNALAGVTIKGSNPTLRRNRIHDGKQGGVYVNDDGLGTLEDNDIFGSAFSGVEIKGQSNPTFRRNLIHDGKQAGVFVQENGKGIFEQNEVFANAGSGMVVRTGGKPVLRGNHISKNQNQAIRVSDGGGGIFEDNDLRDNAKGPWEISEDSKANVTRSGNQE